MKRRRILLVDDEPNVTEGIARRLRRQFDIQTAESGKQGLGVIETAAEPFDVIVSDMRMPGMDGAEFLRLARERCPDTTRVLLTGHADMTSAIKAVNEGQIFRFLTKPCPSDVLAGVLVDGIRQKDLLEAEKTLLEQTLRGSIKALTDVLALAMPAAFGRATRIRDRAHQVAGSVGFEPLWRIEVAAMLSQVGAITLSPEAARKLYVGESLEPDEREAAAKMPAVAGELLSSIPRLEEVVEIIENASPTAKGPPSRGAQILRLVIEHDELMSRSVSAANAAKALRERDYFERDLVRALEASCTEEEGPSDGPIEVPLREIAAGMVLVEDLTTEEGTLLVARGFTVTPGLVDRLRALGQRASGKRTICVRLP